MEVEGRSQIARYSSSLTGLPNSLSRLHPSATSGNKCIGKFVQPANKHGSQEGPARVQSTQLYFLPQLSIFNNVKYLEQLDKTETGRA